MNDALRSVEHARHRVRVARTLLDTIAEDHANAATPDGMEILKASRPLGAPSPRVERKMLLERKLSTAYDELAEAKVRLQDAETRLRDARAAAGETT